MYHIKLLPLGALVDSSQSRWLTKTTAYNEKIAVKSLPLKEYLNFGGVTARKDLNLDTVFNILLKLKKTNNWIEALKEVPRRLVVVRCTQRDFWYKPYFKYLLKFTFYLSIFI